jgi:MbtH protein
MSEEKDERINESAKAIGKEKERIFRVLVNLEEQYSLWAADLKIPNGWESVGPTDTKEVCLSFIKEVWTDLRPKSLRK